MMPASRPRVLGLIPARFASTRLPGKAMLEIAGKPMIQRVLERCRLSNTLDDILVATDDDRIARAVSTAGGRAVMTSPHHPSGTDRLAEAVQNIDCDIVVNIQGDQPFIDARMIDEAVQPLLDDPSLPMATLMQRASHPETTSKPSVVKVVVNRHGNALYFSRSLIPFPRNTTAQPAFEHIGLYAYRRTFLLQLAKLPPTPLELTESLEQLRVLEHGFTLRVVETKSPDHAFTGFSVDTPEDLERARTLALERGMA